MSDYTTLTRYICEEAAGLDHSVGYDKVEEVISQSWNKVFSATWSTFDPSHKQELCTKILRHFYMREIGWETAGLWKLKINSKLAEIMPYYNEQYRIASMVTDVDPLQDIYETTDYDASGTSKRDKAGKDAEAGKTDVEENFKNTQNTNSSTSSSASNNQWDLYQDTPQGGLNGVKENNYLTNARNVNGTTTSSGTDESTSNGTNGGTRNTDYSSTLDRTENETGSTTDKSQTVKQGKRSGIEYAQALAQYGELIRNIDLMIINELEDQFMLIW